jgi:hypothetical protein
MKFSHLLLHIIASAFLLCIGLIQVQAEGWSNTSVGYRYGTQFAEPYLSNDISKRIFNLTHVSSYQYGTNFINADLLLSDSNDPSAVGSTQGAHEVYLVYRNTLDLGKVTGKEIKFRSVRSVAITVGFDLNAKTDAGYNSRKRMLVAGPTLMMDVPGFMNVSVLELWESNAPYNGYTQISTPRYNYKPHPMLDLNWGIPLNIGSIALQFKGYADFIAAKGINEFGSNTVAETHADMRVMYSLTGIKNLDVGFEYEYWKNKYGIDYTGPAGNSAFAKTPIIRVEYYF